MSLTLVESKSNTKDRRDTYIREDGQEVIAITNNDLSAKVRSKSYCENANQNVVRSALKKTGGNTKARLQAKLAARQAKADQE